VFHFIGLDLGTTTVTGALLDVEHREVECLAQRRNDTAIPSPRPTRAEQDPRRLYNLALEVLAELAANGAPVDGIALTGQMHGLLCADAHGQPLTPLISWQDQRTAEALLGASTTLEQIHHRLADLDWLENGCRIHHGYGAATLSWLVGQGTLPPATQRVCTIADWIGGQLADRLPITDPTLAASWGIYSLVAKAWNLAFARRLGLEPRLLPPVRPSGERLGELAPEVAREVGLPAGLPIHNALGDTQASFLGALLASSPLTTHASSPLQAEEAEGGAPGEHSTDDPILFNLGTGGQICWMVPQFEPPNEAVEIRPLPGGRFLRVGASLCGGAAYAWLNHTVRVWLAEFGLELSEETVYRRLNALAEASEDTAGLRVRTTFLGVRGDPTEQADPAMRAGAIEGITPQNMDLSTLARATLMGLVDELGDLYQAHSGKEAGHTHVIATGGGVRKIPLLPGLIEARFGLPVRVPSLQETAAVGAAALPGLAAAR
jgi:sugar (pentulose or hexulose) kinase